MSEDQKDRFGDKLRDAERGREDEYFAKRDRDLLQQLRKDAAGASEADLRLAAHMRCPKDGERLTSRMHVGVHVDECPKCGGMWLDEADLHELARRESSGWLSRFLGRTT